MFLKSILLLLLSISILDAHTRIMLKKYYRYYELGFDYSNSILKDKKNRDKALNSTEEMCRDVAGSIYMDKSYKSFCILGAKDAMGQKNKLKLDVFIENHLKSNSSTI